MNAHRIPIVDDESPRDTLRRLFAHEGRVVTAASCVTEALAKLDPPPLYVLLALMLPGGDGEEVLRKVREEGPRPGSSSTQGRTTRCGWRWSRGWPSCRC